LAENQAQIIWSLAHEKRMSPSLVYLRALISVTVAFLRQAGCKLYLRQGPLVPLQ